MLGAPPRVRGKACMAGKMAQATRITPACAGKSFTTDIVAESAEDHPRVCGEKAGGRRGTAVLTGSPPRVRGKGYPGMPHLRSRRITPACAGKSLIFLQKGVDIRDHPRVCGEKSLSALDVRSSTGSPPRVRGKEFLRQIMVSVDRITPACAGKS